MAHADVIDSDRSLMVTAGQTGEAMTVESVAWQHAGGPGDLLVDEDRPVAVVKGGHLGPDLAKATKPTAADFEREPRKDASEEIAGGN